MGASPQALPSTDHVTGIKLGAPPEAGQLPPVTVAFGAMTELLQGLPLQVCPDGQPEGP